MESRAHWYLLALLVVVTVLSIYAQRRDLPGLYMNWQASEAQVGELHQRVAGLETQTAALEQRVEYLNSDPVELEAAIRSGKRLVREGERVYRIELPDDPRQP